jgi:hypothetical protein
MCSSLVATLEVSSSIRVSELGPIMMSLAEQHDSLMRAVSDGNRCRARRLTHHNPSRAPPAIATAGNDEDAYRHHGAGTTPGSASELN